MYRVEVLRAIAHPVPIRILEELMKGVKCVSDFEDFLEISQPNVSQHLSLLKGHGIIDNYMDGRLRCYFLKDPIIPDLLEILKKDYREELPAPGGGAGAGRAEGLESPQPGQPQEVRALRQREAENVVAHIR